MSYTQDLKNRGMKRLAAQREQKPSWLQAATDAGARIAHAQQLADDLSDAAELARVRIVLDGLLVRKWRLRLKGRGVDIDQLDAPSLLVAIFKEVDEVVNDAN